MPCLCNLACHSMHMAMRSHPKRISCPVLHPVHMGWHRTQHAQAQDRGGYRLIVLCVRLIAEICGTRVVRHSYIESCNVGCQPGAHRPTHSDLQLIVYTQENTRLDIMIIIRISKVLPWSAGAYAFRRVLRLGAALYKGSCQESQGEGGTPWTGVPLALLFDPSISEQYVFSPK